MAQKQDKFITITLPDGSTMIIEMYVGSGLFISHKPLGKKWDYYEAFTTEGFTDKEIRGEDYA